MNKSDIGEMKKIQPAVIFAIATESGMTKDDLLALNREITEMLNEGEITNLSAIITKCSDRYDLESFMVGVLISSVLMRNTIDIHFKKLHDQQNTNMLYSNAEMEFL